MSEMELSLQRFDVECIIGVWAHERVTPQRVGLDLKLVFDASAASVSDRLEDTINYAQLAEAADFILKSGRFQLLETAAHTLTRFFLSPNKSDATAPPRKSVEVRLTKYDALPGDTLSSIAVRAQAQDYTFQHETPTWGRVDIIAESTDMGLYCLNIAPQQTLPLHYHAVMRESEYIVDEGLSLIEEEGLTRVLAPGDVFNWPHRHVHGYQNTGAQWCRVLCVDSPPFIPEDEVLWNNG